MKKILNKEVLSYVIMFMSFFSICIFTNIFTRDLINVNSYGFYRIRFHILWILFSFSWITLFLGILYLIPKKYKYNVFIIMNLIIDIVFFSQICYVQSLGKFMIFSDLFVAGEGLQYVHSIFANMSIGMILTIIFTLICMIIVKILNRKEETLEEEKKPKLVPILIFVSLTLMFRVSAYISLGSNKGVSTWEENYNAKSIYFNYTNPNASMFISGFYEYNVRAVYKYFYNLLTLDKTALKNKIDEYNNIYGTELKDNDYTGIFKGKNVIYVMMESVDSWVVDEETMPTLYKLKETGLNFTNRYSPFFNGGQTINSEFACNTGLYAISDKETIYDKTNMDYPYSIANMLKKNGYKAASFHANTKTFYSRGEFHKRLGYNIHYSALDMQKSGLLDENINYFSDYNFISDDYLFNLMTDKEPFFSFLTTYSGHLEYSVNNKVYKAIKNKKLDRKKYSEEEYVYRTLVNDTDNAIKKLLESLEKKKLLDKTVLVFVSDHYVYGYSDSNYVAMKKNKINDRKELQNTPFIIWSKDIKHKDIDTILDTADILPTLLNMLDIKYDPKNYIGDDVFSTSHDNFVWFSDGTFIKSSSTDQSDESILTKVNYNINKNRDILLTNYYGK